MKPKGLNCNVYYSVIDLLALLSYVKFSFICYTVSSMLVVTACDSTACNIGQEIILLWCTVASHLKSMHRLKEFSGANCLTQHKRIEVGGKTLTSYTLLIALKLPKINGFQNLP